MVGFLKLIFCVANKVDVVSTEEGSNHAAGETDETSFLDACGACFCFVHRVRLWYVSLY